MAIGNSDSLVQLEPVQHEILGLLQMTRQTCRTSSPVELLSLVDLSLGCPPMGSAALGNSTSRTSASFMKIRCQKYVKYMRRLSPKPALELILSAQLYLPVEDEDHPEVGGGRIFSSLTFWVTLSHQD